MRQVSQAFSPFKKPKYASLLMRPLSSPGSLGLTSIIQPDSKGSLLKSSGEPSSTNGIAKYKPFQEGEICNGGSLHGAKAIKSMDLTSL